MEDNDVDINSDVDFINENNYIKDERNIENLKAQVRDINDKLDFQIGFYWWKKYIVMHLEQYFNSVNLCITLIIINTGLKNQRLI